MIPSTAVARAVERNHTSPLLTQYEQPDVSYTSVDPIQALISQHTPPKDKIDISYLTSILSSLSTQDPTTSHNLLDAIDKHVQEQDAAKIKANGVKTEIMAWDELGSMMQDRHKQRPAAGNTTISSNNSDMIDSDDSDFGEQVKKRKANNKKTTGNKTTSAGGSKTGTTRGPTRGALPQGTLPAGMTVLDLDDSDDDDYIAPLPVNNQGLNKNNNKKNNTRHGPISMSLRSDNSTPLAQSLAYGSMLGGAQGSSRAMPFFNLVINESDEDDNDSNISSDDDDDYMYKNRTTQQQQQQQQQKSSNVMLSPKAIVKGGNASPEGDDDDDVPPPPPIRSNPVSPRPAPPLPEECDGDDDDDDDDDDEPAPPPPTHRNTIVAVTSNDTTTTAPTGYVRGSIAARMAALKREKVANDNTKTSTLAATTTSNVSNDTAVARAAAPTTTAPPVPARRSPTVASPTVTAPTAPTASTTAAPTQQQQQHANLTLSLSSSASSSSSSKMKTSSTTATTTTTPPTTIATGAKETDTISSSASLFGFEPIISPSKPLHESKLAQEIDDSGLVMIVRRHNDQARASGRLPGSDPFLGTLQQSMSFPHQQQQQQQQQSQSQRKLHRGTLAAQNIPSQGSQLVMLRFSIDTVSPVNINIIPSMLIIDVIAIALDVALSQGSVLPSTMSHHYNMCLWCDDEQGPDEDMPPFNNNDPISKIDLSSLELVIVPTKDAYQAGAASGASGSSGAYIHGGGGGSASSDYMDNTIDHKFNKYKQNTVSGLHRDGSSDELSSSRLGHNTNTHNGYIHGRDKHSDTVVQNTLLNSSNNHHHNIGQYDAPTVMMEVTDESLNSLDSVEKYVHHLYSQYTPKDLNEYHEYLVTKINLKGKSQERYFGLDRHNVYNKSTPTSNFNKVSRLFHITKEERPISSIVRVTIDPTSLDTFEIAYKLGNDVTTRGYKTKSMLVLAEIVARLRYLINHIDINAS